MIATFSTKINVRFILFVCLFSGESKLYLKQITCYIFFLNSTVVVTPPAGLRQNMAPGI